MKLRILNDRIKNCTLCRLHETRNHSLPGEGNADARLFIIPQAPGTLEDEKGKMFIGPSGKIFNYLIKNAGVTWDDFYISNLIKCQLPKCRKPKQDEIIKCSSYLDMEIETINPDILVPLGYYATNYIFKKYFHPEISKKEFPVKLAKLFSAGDKKIFPLSHPAALLFDRSLKEGLMRNYKKLNILKKVCKWFPICPIKYLTEKNRIDDKWADLYCKGDWEVCIRFQMEESGQYHPDNMLPDGSYN